MAAAVRRHGVALRPHMKTARSAAVARLATAGHAGGITVSTLAEAEYFAREGFGDILYAVGIVPAKLDRAAVLRRAGIDLIIVTDDRDTAVAIAAHARRPARSIASLSRSIAASTAAASLRKATR